MCVCIIYIKICVTVFYNVVVVFAVERERETLFRGKVKGMRIQLRTVLVLKLLGKEKLNHMAPLSRMVMVTKTVMVKENKKE